MSPQIEKFYDHLFHVYEELLLLKKENWKTYLYENPIIFSKRNSYAVYQSIEAGYFKLIPRLKHLSSEEILAPMQSIISMSKHFAKFPMDYPFGTGPVEQIWKQFEAKEISLAYAEKLITNDSLYISTENYIYCLCNYCESLAHEGNWRKAISLFKILKTGIEHRNYYPWHDIDKEQIVLTWLDLVSCATNEIPDARYFNDAVETAKEFIGKTDDRYSLYDKEELFHRLAVIHFDPYFAGKSLIDYESAFRAWQLKLTYEFGNEIQHWNEKDQYMPSPKETIPKAIEYGLKAIKVRKGIPRARSLKVVVDAMFSAKLLQYPIDTSNLLPFAEEAQSIFKEFPDERQGYEALTSIIDYVKKAKISSLQDTYFEELEALLTTDLKELYTSKSIKELRINITKIGVSLQSIEPEKCLNLLLRHESLIYEETNGNQVKIYFNLMMSCLFNQYIPEFFKIKTDFYEELQHALQKSISAENWTINEITAAHLKICVLCAESNQEEKGLEHLKYILHANKPFVEKYRSVYTHIETILYVGKAVNYFDKNSFTESIENYIIALKILLKAKRTEEAKDLLFRIQHIVMEKSGYDIGYVAVAIGTQLSNLQIRIGVETIQIANTIFKRLLSKFIHIGDYDTRLLGLLLQVYKGYLFNNIMEAPISVHWSQNKELVVLDTKIKNLQKKRTLELEKQGVPYEKKILDDEMIIGSVYGKSISLKGESTKDKILNLQQVFDAKFQRFLVKQHLNENAFLHKHFSEIQSKIPKNTVVIDYSFGQNHIGGAQVYITIITSANLHFTVSNMADVPSGYISMTSEGKKVTYNLLTYFVGKIRKHIVEEPGFKNISTEATDLLVIEHKIYFGGPVLEILNKLRKKGIDHLCIVPCDTLFFYPFHLLGEEDEPIAKHWKISYIPNIQYLTKDITKTTSNPEISIFAVKDTEAAPAYLHPLVHVEAEAKAIGDIFGVEPIIGEYATEEAFYKAMSESTYVHLASHGEHNVYAPCYHAIYLQPSAKTNGIVNAYEIYGNDFSNVELLTLSACETALGRVDLASNLYGLPAAFFHAGVKTIVGTLWEVETTAAAFFFTTFYQNLKDSQNKLDAFYTAQKITRISFPEYRDWGAFYYMGDF
ncbi:CHAT domain-containing protein [uncultured Kordia sp.]|uniref:CHAT domain-containing protein n=1 Tax=uncultured Kordia sp. TaxID=507699 RepID=UPI002619790F|nr:CHAT domain-containing protein [uncultured Kordia sp.]